MMRRVLLSALLCSALGGASQGDPCLLVPDPGPCEAYIPAWHFDPVTQTCAEFIWGGCDGVVPFQTLAACQAAGCVGDTLDYPVCDSIVVTPVSMGTWPSGVDHVTVLVDVVFDSQVWISYCGFALSDAEGNLIAAESPLTAPNAYGFGGGGGAYSEERFLDLEPGVDLQGSPPPFPWTLRLFEGWMAGGADLVCEWTWTELNLTADVPLEGTDRPDVATGYFDLLGRPSAPVPGKILIHRSPNGTVRKVWITE